MITYAVNNPREAKEKRRWKLKIFTPVRPVYGMRNLYLQEKKLLRGYRETIQTQNVASVDVTRQHYSKNCPMGYLAYGRAFAEQTGAENTSEDKAPYQVLVP